MPLRFDILNPIPGDNPSGENLEYAPVYDQIKQARREDDGDWLDEQVRKTADWRLVVQLAGDVIATKSKDLQIAAWLTEGLLKTEGFAGLRAGLELNRSVLETFWDTLYPPIEDGDLEFRAAPLEWIGTRLNDSIQNVPLTKSGYSFFKYKESRTVGYEEDPNVKPAVRETAIAEGKLTPEAFDKSFNETPDDFYQRAVGQLDACLEAANTLGAVCDEKFGKQSPNLIKLRETLEDVRRTANSLYQQKRKEAGELVEPAAAEPAEEEEAVVEAEAVPATSSSTAAAPARAPARKAAAGLDPVDKEEVPARLTAIAKFLRNQDGYDPSPYLMLRGYRWGELRKDAPTPSQTLLEAPSSEVRTQLKAAMLESDWAKVVEIGEAAMAQPCGRGWLDLQRYMVTALEKWEAPLIAAAIKSEVRALIHDIPDLPRWTLMDDTPTANAETQTWLAQIIAEPGAPAAAIHEDEEREQAPPDAYELALQAIRQGRSKESIEILALEIARESSGRGRFRRKQQLAEVCIKLGKTEVAQPILEGLLAEIDEHKLEDWESSDTVASPLTMLLDCLAKLNGDEALRHKIYHRICRLDPVQALNIKP